MRKSSKGKFRMIAALILSVFIVASSGVPTYAASGVDRSKLASLRIQPRYGNTDIAGGTFAVYQVATISDYNMLTYELVYPFSLSSVDINHVKKANEIIDASEELAKYVSQAQIGSAISVNGGQTIDDLPLGIYLILNTSVPSNYRAAAPFLSFLPIYDGEWIYDYTAYPKLGYVAPEDGGGEEEDGGDEGGGDGGGSSTSESNVTVPDNETPRGVTVPQTEQTVETPPEAPVTAPEETVTIDPDETPLAAPQTGMLQWPIPIFGTLGCLLTGSGIVVGRDKKENEE